MPETLPRSKRPFEQNETPPFPPMLVGESPTLNGNDGRLLGRKRSDQSALNRHPDGRIVFSDLGGEEQASPSDYLEGAAAFFFEVADSFAARYPAFCASASVMNLPLFVVP